MKKIISAITLIAGPSFLTSSAQGELLITEVMSSSINSGDDWFELTNSGTSSIDLDGFYWTDDTGDVGTTGAIFGDVTIDAGESIIILEGDATSVADFQGFWGTDFQIIPEVDFIDGGNTFSGLSSDGDQITLFDADPNAGGPFSIVDSVTFPAATGGVSFEFDADGLSSLSAAGVNGAVQSGSDIASPGFSTVAVPEPSSFALLALGLSALGFRRRR